MIESSETLRLCVNCPHITVFTYHTYRSQKIIFTRVSCSPKVYICIGYFIYGHYVRKVRKATVFSLIIDSKSCLIQCRV